MTYHALLVALTFLLAGCARTATDQAPMVTDTEAPPTFAEDVRFLEQHGPVQVLEAPSGARVALSAQYQGRVMTSAVAPGRRSLGWINRDFIEAGQTGTAFDNYGGEDRFWLGPEGGQYGLYFAPGSAFEFSNWQVPAAFAEGAWTIEEQSDTSVTYTRSMQVTNYGGTTFDLNVERTVRLLTDDDVAAHLDTAVPDGAQWVGFETINRVTNTGEEAWQEETGQPSIWILGQYEPFGTTYVVIPFDTSATTSEEIVNDAYFGEVPPGRLAVRDGYVLFKCDGEYRSKIGLGPTRATPLLGSYNAEIQLLTLVQYNKPSGATDYVNSMWEMQEEPYGGDVVNAYNDGPPEPGMDPLGGFYEMETSSPALALQPGESYTHVHRTVHLVADSTPVLEPVAQDVLGVSLSTVAQGIR